MKFPIDYDKLLSFTKLCAYPACTWPPSSSATKWQIIRYNIRWCICFINALWMCLGLVVSIYKYRENSLIVTQSACVVGSMAALMIKMIAFKMQLKLTQTRIEEMENFLKIARPHERMVLRRYLPTLSILHVFICISVYLAASMVVFAPLLLHHQPSPFMVVYPFSVDTGVVKCLAFIQQGFVACQCASSSATSCQSGVMMWFAGAQLEILAEETRSISEKRGIPDFVEKHRNRLAYAADVAKSMRYVALAASIAGGLAAIMSSLVLFDNQPFFHKVPFVPVVIGSLLNLFLCGWPADNLINVCHLLGNAVYDISWFDMPVRSRKSLLMIIQRSQRPVIVSVGGLLPTVSLRSYAAFLSAVFSYFMTLRAVTSEGTNS